MRLAAAALLSAALLAPDAATAVPAASASGAPDAVRRARLLLSNDDPFRVRGSNFRRRELVRVTVTALGATTGRTRRVRAGARGTFVLAFPGIEPCHGVRARAIGSRGSRAAFVLNSVTC